MFKVAVASGKGGTGKTLVSTCLYQRMVEAGLNVGVVDCDAEVPNAALFLQGTQLQQYPVSVFFPTISTDRCTYCGLCAEVCHYHAITCIPVAHYIKVMPDICHACTACRELCPAKAVAEGLKEVGEVRIYGEGAGSHLIEARIKEGEHSPVPVIRSAIGKANQAGWDYMILDAPPGCACPFVNTVKDADLVFLVSEPTPFGLSDLRHTVKVLRQLKKNFVVIINRADLGDGQMKEYLKQENIKWAAEFPYSETIAVACSKGKIAIREIPDLRDAFTTLMNNVLQYESSCR